MSAGTKNNTKCSSEDFNGSCDGHAEALCYETVVHYFLKLIRKKNFNVLLLSREGFQLNPEYKFHLFISHPPCGFMINESEPLISWKTPFVEEPHVLTCSSKIVLNSYFGIQGPLICLFAKPVYISEVIILHNDDTITEKTHKKFEEATNKLAPQSLFSFHPPEVKVLKVPKLCGIDNIGAKNHNAQEGSSGAVLRNPDDDCNPIFSVKIFKKNNEKTKGSKATEKVYNNEMLFDINDLVWSKIPIKLHFKEFDEIHKVIIENLKIFQELQELSKKLKEDCEHTASNLKEKIGKASAEVTKLVEEMDYKCYKKANLAAKKFLRDVVINLQDQKENELRMIEDIRVLLDKSKAGSVPMCCCWKRYLTLLQLLEEEKSKAVLKQ
ncbi:uncharacterized protein [Dysidea avara]|uniref:uncharacterized protein n=1 Tax=Dysidea avara TaxID=196820 RepID=UPI0033306A5A